ncbi:hypothetical protein [Enterococcus sp. AZ109]|uniref:hypothetical protein n=1 Tax=Enterococcus sp. AZ109 TaxID=2774634 RepID=UPI003F1F9834
MEKMIDEPNKMVEGYNAVYGFKIEDGKIRTPKYNFPKEVKERIQYIGSEGENGLVVRKSKSANVRKYGQNKKH